VEKDVLRRVAGGPDAQQANLPTKKVRTCKLLAGGKGWQGSLSPAHMTSSWARSPSAAGRALPVDRKLIGIAASVHGVQGRKKRVRWGPQKGRY
jgi:hypothetical protein